MIPKKLIAVLLVTSFSLTGCGLVETTKEKLGLEQSAEELVAEACALYSKNSQDPGAEAIGLLRQAVDKDESYRTLLENMKATSMNWAVLKIIKNNPQVGSALILKILETEAYIGTYCK